MAEWPEDVLGHADAPRRLPPTVRGRLEEALLTGDLSSQPTPSSLGEDDASRPTVAIGDPVADALEDIDGPRPLRPGTDKSLEHAFAHRSNRRRVTVLSAAAAVVLLATGLTLAVSDAGRTPSGSANRAAAPPSTTPGTGTNNTAGSSASAAAGGADQARHALGSDNATTPAGPDAVSAPAVATISPVSGPTAGGTAVTITGSGMETAASVRFGSVPAHFQIVSATQLRAVAPAHTAGVVAVTVSTGANTSFSSTNVHFTYH